MLNNAKLQTRAPGKINFYLDVLNKREDGYHNIKSVMQSVSLCDTVYLDAAENTDGLSIEITCSVPEIKCDESNLVYKAAMAFFKKCGITCGYFKFHIDKSIPIAAGMAGGSADAAAAISLLNEAYGNPLTTEEMCALGATVGADVPFCIMKGTCICEGIGEKITRLPDFSGVDIVCAIDSSSVSTPRAFSMLDAKYGTDCTDSSNITELLNAIKSYNVMGVCSNLYNKFEDVIIPENENIALIKSMLTECGALSALMSGSGPSVFGIFLNENDAEKAKNALLSKNIRAYRCKTM
jgi:4-diphosphocytidyl-2-C-methyl-D-erythritol kinase